MSWKQLCASHSATWLQPRAGRPGDTAAGVGAGPGLLSVVAPRDTTGQPLVSGDGPGHRFSTCSSQGLLLVTVSAAPWLQQTKVRASSCTGGTSEHRHWGQGHNRVLPRASQNPKGLWGNDTCW